MVIEQQMVLDSYASGNLLLVGTLSGTATLNMETGPAGTLTSNLVGPMGSMRSS